MTYTIVPVPVPDSPLWADVVQTPATAQRSTDGALCLLAWGGVRPETVPADAPVYYHPAETPEDCGPYAGDIVSALSSPAWSGFGDTT